MRYTQTDISAARAARRMSELLAVTTTLRRTGEGRFMALCPFHAESTPSFSIRDNIGWGHCFGCGWSGDVIDFVVELRGMPFAEAVRWLLSEPVPIGPRRIGPIAQQVTDDAQRRARSALMTWVSLAPIRHTPAERYLESRKIRHGIAADDLRYADRAYCSVTREERPALVAALRDAVGDVTALQFVFLDEVGRPLRTRDGNKIKRTYGSMGDGAVRLYPPQPTMGITGAVEDALSAEALYRLPVWATCGEGRLHRVAIPELVNHLVIFGDADDAGRALAEKARAAHASPGRTVTVLYPDHGKDYNEYLIGGGYAVTA